MYLLIHVFIGEANVLVHMILGDKSEKRFLLLLCALRKGHVIRAFRF